MKKCPYCAEEIQDEAIKCKHCASDLSLPSPAPSSPQPSPASIPAPAAVIKTGSYRTLKSWGFILIVGGLLGGMIGMISHPAFLPIGGIAMFAGFVLFVAGRLAE